MATGFPTIFSFGVGGSRPVALTATRDLTSRDNGRTLVSPAGAVTLTLPADLPLGFTCTVVQGGAGQVTFAAGAGATLANVASQTKTSAINAVVQVWSTAQSAFILAGSTGA